MPYCKQAAKDAIDRGAPPQDAGELTYKFYRTALDYLKGRKRCYLNFAIVLGCLLCTILELYRCKAAPYEDEKIKENGDVT